MYHAQTFQLFGQYFHRIVFGTFPVEHGYLAYARFFENVGKIPARRVQVRRLHIFYERLHVVFVIGAVGRAEQGIHVAAPQFFDLCERRTGAFGAEQFAEKNFAAESADGAVFRNEYDLVAHGREQLFQGYQLPPACGAEKYPFFIKLFDEGEYLAGEFSFGVEQRSVKIACGKFYHMVLSLCFARIHAGFHIKGAKKRSTER